MIFFVLTAVIFLGGCGTVLAQNEPIIGLSYYAPTTDLLTEQLTGGFPVFKDLPSNCIINGSEAGQVVDNSLFFEDTATFYSSLSTSTSLSADLQNDFTLGLTLDVTTKSISGSSRTIRGFTMNTYSAATKDYIKDQCINDQPLADQLVADFEKLPSEIKNPWLKSSWVDYQGFFIRYHSHLVTQVIYGSSIFQHCFSDSSNKYTERDYNVKACVDFVGPTPAGLLSVKACQSITQAEISNVTNLKTSKQTVLRGGTLKTRTELYQNRTPELIAEFLSEANRTHIAIQYKLMPIWNILKNKYLGTKHMARAINLEQYYKGYLNFECSYLKSHGVELQRFVTHPDSLPTYPLYQCEIAPHGCQDDDDCHYRDAFWCECRGDSCVRYRTASLDTGVTRRIPYMNTEPGWGWQGCNRHVFTCYCTDRDYFWVTVWDPSLDDGCKLNQLKHLQLLSDAKHVKNEL